MVSRPTLRKARRPDPGHTGHQGPDPQNQFSAAGRAEGIDNRMSKNAPDLQTGNNTTDGGAQMDGFAELTPMPQPIVLTIRQKNPFNFGTDIHE